MDDTISRKAAIDALETVGYDFSESELSEVELEEVCGTVSDVRQDMIDRIKQLPPAQPTIMYIIMETLAECGIYGEEATIKLIGTLKRIGRDDLLPPCAR